MIRSQGHIASLAIPPLLLVFAAMVCGAALRLLPGGSIFADQATYLPFHSVLEMVSIAVSLMVFSLGWTIRRAEHGGRNMIIGLAALAAAVFDFFHTLSFPGMPPLVTPSSVEKGINLWLLGRLAMALGIGLACTRLTDRLDGTGGRGGLGLILALTAAATTLSLTRPEAFPDTFVSGQGLTPFKIWSEYAIALVYVASSSVLFLRYRRTGDANELKLAAAAWVLALSGALMTLYGDSGDFFNLAGHVGKAVAYALIYGALFASGVQTPYAALAKERALLRTLMDSVPDLIFFKDPQSRYLGFNRAFAAYCGRSETDMAGKSDDEFTDPETAEYYRLRDRAAMAAGRPSLNEEWIDYPDGRKVLLETIKAPILGGDGVPLGMVGVSRDITDRKLAEERLRRAHYDLEMVTAVAAHDLQEPARTIASFLQLLQMRYAGKLGEDADQYISYAVEGAHRMRAQLTGLLEYTLIDQGDTTFPPVDTAVVLEEALEGLRPRIETAQAVVTHAGLPVLNGDAGQLRVLFSHLLGNAIKFRHPDRKPDIHVSGTRRNGVWELAFEDNGIGIDREYWDKIFVVFQRLHPLNLYDGTGIGLAICKKIVERHGGQIRVESRPGQGSTFLVTLPARS